MIHVIITIIWAYLFNALPYIATLNLLLTTIILIKQITNKK